MARRGPKGRPVGTPGDASDPHSLASHLVDYLEWRHAKGFTESTIRGDRYGIGYFITWAKERGITNPAEVTRPILTRYQLHLSHWRTKEGWPLLYRTQYGRLTLLQGFFKWLSKTNVILYNVAADLELPKREKRLPRSVLSASEAEAVINGADVTTSLGVRDRAILETFYSTGMRRAELIGLARFDLDARRGMVMIREGKGRKDRFIPIGERAVTWIDRYLRTVRPELVVSPDAGVLFLTVAGTPFSSNRLSELVREYVEKADLGKWGSCHLFRHTMATLMLENGADIRFIQAMLGHAELTSTQIYTQVSIRKLKEIHSATHPAKMTRTNDAARMLAEETPAMEKHAAPAPMLGDDRAALLATLEAEAAEDGEG